jgi:hypothetical protein
MTLPKQAGTVLGVVGFGLELPLIITLFFLRDSVSITTALGLPVIGMWVGVAGIAIAAAKRSRMGIVVTVLPCGGWAFILFVFWTRQRLRRRLVATG